MTAHPRAACVALLIQIASACAAADAFPRVQVIPQPHDSISFEFDGREILRYNYGRDASKPYFYPLIGPAGRPVTRITHPHDPDTHRHHLSLWIAHQFVDGVNFWEAAKDPATGPHIVQDKIVKIDDGDTGTLTVQGRWLDGAGKSLLRDDRTWRFIPRVTPTGEFFLDLELTLTPEGNELTLKKTNFGLLAVRVAKTMDVNDGGGVISDSEGRVTEKAIFNQRARWCDYSGPAAPGKDGAPLLINGVTLFDHPANPNHPTFWHVRSDGWMGASFTHEADYTIQKAAPLKLRYRFWIHDGACDAAKSESVWKEWGGK